MKPVLIVLLIAIVACTAQNSNYPVENTFPLSNIGLGYSINFTGASYLKSGVTFPLLIDLTSPHTMLLNGTCLGFSSVDVISSETVCGDDDTDCSTSYDSICTGTSSSETFYWPYYSVEYLPCNTPIYVSTSNLSNLNNLPIIPSISFQCFPYHNVPFMPEGSDDSDFGSGKFGTVGFGYAQGSNNETYILTPGFNVMTIYLNRSTSNGFLTLGSPNLTYATTTTPLISIPTLQNSNVTSMTILQGIGDFTSFQYGNTKINVSAPLPSTIIWDLNCPYLAFSSSTYQDIYNTLSSSGLFAYCQEAGQGGAGITCSLVNGNASSLPNLYVNAGNCTIPIPPQIYVSDYDMHLQNGTNSTLTLNFISIEEEESDYVANTTIFGSCFFSYYYTVFNAANRTVDLYIAVDTFPHQAAIQPVADAPTKANPLTWIIPVAIVLILIVCLLLYRLHKNRQEKDNEKSLSNVKSDESLSEDIRSQFDNHLIPSR